MSEKPKILVADDMMMDREVLSTLLERDYEVTAVADGAAAIDAIDANSGAFDCILLDIFMPVKDGFAVLDHLRTCGYAEKVPVIALTSLSDAEAHIRCYEAGVTQVLEKPYNRKILLYRIQQAIAGVKSKLGVCNVRENRNPQSKLLLAFQSDFNNTVVALRKAVADGDQVALHAVSHAFLGLQTNLSLLINGLE